MAAASARPRLFHSRAELLRLFAVGVGLPALIVIVDELLFSWLLGAGETFWGLGVFFVVMVLQIGILTFAIARWIAPAVLAAATYMWALLLLNLLLIEHQLGRGGGVATLSYALGCGQIGLVGFWLVFGHIGWMWRCIAVGLVVTATAAWLPLLYRAPAWFALFGLQFIGVSVALLVLWAFGFRMLHESTLAAESASTESRPQFSLGQLIALSTAAAVAFLIVQALDVETFRYMEFLDFAQTASIAVCLSILCAAAVWAALGRGNTLVRFVVFLALAFVAAGLIYWAYVVRTDAITAVTRIWNLNYVRRELYWIGGWWFVWTPLVGLFLAELLLIFRLRGYRLVRRTR